MVEISTLFGPEAISKAVKNHVNGSTSIIQLHRTKNYTKPTLEVHTGCQTKLYPPPSVIDISTEKSPKKKLDIHFPVYSINFVLQGAARKASA